MPSPEPRKLVYRLEAERDLADLFDFIAADRPLAAERFLGEIKRACEGLRWFPFIGRRLDFENESVRVLTVRRRAAIKYVVAEDRIHILGVAYLGRNLTDFFDGRRP